MNEYLSPSPCVNSDHPAVVALANELTSAEASQLENGLALYYWVRDKIRYNPYGIAMTTETLAASHTLAAGEGWCVPKAALLAALCRAAGIPARLGFADVRNHLSTERMRQSMDTDVFYYHGYTSLFLEDKWVKATPAFNIELCEKFGLHPLEFNGLEDSLYHEFDQRRWYPIRLRVTCPRIEVWTGEEKLIDLATEGRTFTLYWEMEPALPFGVATWRTTGALRKIRVRPIEAEPDSEE